jgi:hypothetical protein
MGYQTNAARRNLSEPVKPSPENVIVPAAGGRIKKAVSLEGLVFLAVFISFFCVIGAKMGMVNMVNTMMRTAYDILISTVFFIMAIAVLAGAAAELFSEFGVISMANKLLSPLIKPLFGLPGASVVGIFATYLSDNPAILTLANNQAFLRFFKKYQVPALTNIGTTFGMGLIITTFMISVPAPEGENFVAAALIGNVGAVVGGIVSTKLMLLFTVKIFGGQEGASQADGDAGSFDIINFRKTREGNPAARFLEALLEGGKRGVDMGICVIPGVLIICTAVLMLTNGVPENGFYTGAAYEGIGLLPFAAGKIQFPLSKVWGFSSPEAIAVPITSLGAAGAAISLVPKLVAEGFVHANDIAVFTAMCMCWSGYLSTHVAMMESLGYRSLTGKAIFCHTIGGLCAGIAANMIFHFVGVVM